MARVEKLEGKLEKMGGGGVGACNEEVESWER